MPDSGDSNDLVALRNALNDAHLAVQCISMTNTVGLTPDEQAEVDIQYDLARRRYAKAQVDYWTALEKKAAAVTEST